MTNFNSNLVSKYSDEMFDMKFDCFFTSVNGTILAEVNGHKYWETVDIASKFGYGESVEVGYFYDAWELVDYLESIAC